MRLSRLFGYSNMDIPRQQENIENSLKLKLFMTTVGFCPNPAKRLVIKEAM